MDMFECNLPEFDGLATRERFCCQRVELAHFHSQWHNLASCSQKLRSIPLVWRGAMKDVTETFATTVQLASEGNEMHKNSGALANRDVRLRPWVSN
jgi:hypothetical protein